MPYNSLMVQQVCVYSLGMTLYYASEYKVPVGKVCNNCRLRNKYATLIIQWVFISWRGSEIVEILSVLYVLSTQFFMLHMYTITINYVQYTIYLLIRKSYSWRDKRRTTLLSPIYSVESQLSCYSNHKVIIKRN